MIDKKFIGSETPVRTFEVERYPIRCFARAIGETNPIHSDEAAAQRAGFRSLVAPPTFAFCVNMMASDAALGQLFREMGVSFLNLLHGEQSFTYHQPIVAGDVLTLRSRIVDVYEKKGGALGFVVFETAVANERGERVVDLRNVSVVRN